MVTKQPGVDYSIITNAPVAKARIDPSTGQMNYDMGFISKKQGDPAMEGVANKEKANEAEFNTSRQPNKAYSSKDYQTAIDKYKEAKALKPDHPGPDDKIAQAKAKMEEMQRIRAFAKLMLR